MDPAPPTHEPLPTEPVDLPDPAAPASPQPLDAIAEPQRINALDVARGLALLGIFLVNIEFFARPLGKMLDRLPPPAGEGPAGAAAFYFVAIFCEGKFYPLFSMLFGIGFMIQLTRAREAGRPFVPMYLRRLGFLAVLGLGHALLLWYGDVLFFYSVAGLILFAFAMIFQRAGPRVYFVVGACLIAFSILCGSAMVALETLAPDGAEEAPAPATIEAEGSPAARLWQGLREGEVQNPDDPLWMELETLAYQEGPWFQTFVFRAISYAGALVFTIFLFGWHVLGMFFIGAGLMRAGAFDAGRLHWHRRLLWLGVLVGFPLVLAGVLAPRFSESAWILLFPMVFNLAGGPLMSLAYLAGMTLLTATGALSLVTGGLARVGRMALTNYLLQTVIATGIMYHWGLGWFGTTTHVERVGIVCAVYAGQVGLSMLWMRIWAMGPMEWLWRSFTYLRLQQALRAL